MARLLEIMKKLREPEGCPWDREQTLKTLIPYLLEECGEVIDAIERGDMVELEDELGDLLLQVVFQCELCREDGFFEFEDVAGRISDKLIRRHPHVFGEVVVNNSGEVLENWREIKKNEKAGTGKEHKSAVDGVPRHIPALMRAYKFQKKASVVGFDWEDHHGALEKMEEEFWEFKEAVLEENPEHIHEELGDLLFSMVNVGRKLEVKAETALQSAVRKFQDRFTKLEKELKKEGRELEDCSLSELDEAWDSVKENECT